MLTSVSSQWWVRACLFCDFELITCFGNISYQESTEFEVRESELESHLLGQATQFLNVLTCKMQMMIQLCVGCDAQDKAFEAFYELGVII